MGKICEVLKIPYHIESFPENSKVNVRQVEELLMDDPSFSMVAVVHCETSSGVINPVVELGQSIKRLIPSKSLIIIILNVKLSCCFLFFLRGSTSVKRKNT